MSLFIIVLPIIIIIIVISSLKGKVPAHISLNKKWTYLFLTAYIIILLIATITSEIMSSHYTEQPKKIAQEELDKIEKALANGTLATTMPSLVIDQRTHEIGDVLAISTIDKETYPNITIERKEVNDGLIEETIFKPQLVVDEYDLSDHLHYVLPEWSKDQLTFHNPPLSTINLVSYEDAFFAKQFTSAPRSMFGGSSSSMSREIIVHLIVPKDLKIIADDHLYIDYVIN